MEKDEGRDGEKSWVGSVLDSVCYLPFLEISVYFLEATAYIVERSSSNPQGRSFQHKSKSCTGKCDT
jgi:hypothetical protein